MLEPGNDLAGVQRRLVTAVVSGEDQAISDSQTDLLYPERLSAHVDGYPGFYDDTLVNFFPRLSQLIGDDLELVIAEFSRAGNTSHYDLGEVVASFGEFFEAHPRVQAYPFLIDLVRFEVYEHRVYHSAPPSPVEIPTLVNDLVAGRAQLTLQDHVRIQSCNYDLAGYMDTEPEIANLDDLEGYRRPSELLIFQQNWLSRYLAMSNAETLFLQHLLGDSLTAACTAVSERYPETTDLSPVLLDWLQRGLLRPVDQDA